MKILSQNLVAMCQSAHRDQKGAIRFQQAPSGRELASEMTEGECGREFLPSRQSLSTSLGDGGNRRFVNRPYSKAQANTTKEKRSN